ncbi:MAG TPA: amidohydrolase family protein [Gemmatimonadaceae bacterium]|nr:amidohydrolase family protein [Gemmatimonadaceae bacterium]
MRRSLLLLAAALCPCVVFAQGRAGSARADTGLFDLIIAGGRIYDGTGNPWFYADVGIRGGRIAAVGRLDSARATRRVDAKGKAVIPGIIDLHSHADDGSSPRGGFRDPNAKRRAAPNLVMQGVTTVVVNQDGRSPLPIAEQRATVERLGIGPNAILLVGHGSVRARVMGTDFRRAARPEEIAAMRELVRQGLREGAWGLSAGLEYTPGRWSTTDEVVALAQEIVPYRGVYISHERSEGQDPMWFWPSQDPPGAPTLLDAVRETIEIGERTGATVVASHLKAKGFNYWGSSNAALELIERARARGVDVWADQYPYNTSGSDGSTVLVPDWALGSGDYAAGLRRTLADSTLAAKVRRDIAHEIARRGGAEQVMIFDFPDSALNGKTLSQIAAGWSVTPIEGAIQLQLRGYPSRRGGARVRGFSLAEGDIELIATRSWVATASDAGIALPEDGPATHARFYGTFPRKLRRYALERDVLSFESAIRSMTSLPAQILGLRDRGMIREGMVADIALIDPTTIRDKATFFQPHQYAEGVLGVWVNGIEVVANGQPTWALPGRVLTKTGPRFQP